MDIHDVSHRRYLAKFPGTKGAVKYLNNHREDDDVVVINSPFVHTIVLQYLDETAQVYTISAGDHRENILSGLALRESDLLPEEFFSSSPDTLWTIDTVGLFKRKSLTDVPLGYEVISEHRFAERFHFRMDHIVRKYKSSLIP